MSKQKKNFKGIAKIDNIFNCPFNLGRRGEALYGLVWQGIVNQPDLVRCGAERLGRMRLGSARLDMEWHGGIRNGMD